jgi:signal transduction histidine kinase
MAHDIRNPIASIKASVQFLSAERAAGRSIDAQQKFLELVDGQCDRLNRLVDHYQRIGRADPHFAPADLNDAVKESVGFLNGTQQLSVKLAEQLPQFQADRDLFVIALENILRNAHEAAPGKPIAVETGTTNDLEGRSIFVTIRDEGPGMDARTRERALDGFFTTKTTGSGLGLAFVRRVVEAHRGRLLIDSREGAGTTVRIVLRA